MKSRKYTVTDGKMVIMLEDAEEGGYIVTSPMDPELITEADSIAEAFENAKDAAKCLRLSRAKGMRRLASEAARARVGA